MIGRMTSRITYFVKWTWRGLVLLAVLMLLGASFPHRSGEQYVYDHVIRSRRFNFVEWEVVALWNKALYSLAPPHASLVDAEQQRLVLDFFALLREAALLRQEVDTAYADPAIADPDSVTVDLRMQLDQTRERIDHIQPLAEGALEEQIATVLVAHGIATAERVFPPVQLHFTPLPAMLVVSPRDRIEAIRFSALEPGLSIQDWIEIEDAVAKELNVSTLVTAIGGLAAYPAMMLETSSLTWVAETGAHEWTHHYLTLHPLGLLYDTSPELRAMNETVANIVGREIGAEVIRRFYPEFAPPPPQPDEEGPAQPVEKEPERFDFRAEMHTTRIHVDQLLAQGKIEEAEAYMENRRHFFWENGYRIRKLNQAYFAFHGAYADEPGQRGEDPVGPAVLELRQQSASLRDFLYRVRGLTSFDDLQQLIEG